MNRQATELNGPNQVLERTRRSAAVPIVASRITGLPPLRDWVVGLARFATLRLVMQTESNRAISSG
jgi:hypothetical protein